MQGQCENPTVILSCLAEAMKNYVHLDPLSPEVLVILNLNFISQSASNIRRKLQKIDDGPHAPWQDLLSLALKVFNNWDEAERKLKVTEKAAEY